MQDNLYQFLFDPNANVFYGNIFSSVDRNMGGSNPPPPSEQESVKSVVTAPPTTMVGRLMEMFRGIFRR